MLGLHCSLVLQPAITATIAQTIPNGRMKRSPPRALLHTNWSDHLSSTKRLLPGVAPGPRPRSGGSVGEVVVAGAPPGRVVVVLVELVARLLVVHDSGQ